MIGGRQEQSQQRPPTKTDEGRNPKVLEAEEMAGDSVGKIIAAQS